MFARLFILVPAIATVALAQESPSPAPALEPAAEKAAEPVKPSVKKLDGTRYQTGGVIFDQKTREIRFPAVVNMTEGLLEFLIVHKNGKVHEALLATEISPIHLNLAFTLLRYPPSRELYPLPNETGDVSDKFPDVPPEIKAAARVSIDAEWKDGDRIRRLPVNEWIQHEVKSTSMPAGPWVYGGSDFTNGKYAPETTGDITSIFMSVASVLYYPGVDYNNDDVWTPFPKRVPEPGTPVTVIISPYQNAKPIPKP